MESAGKKQRKKILVVDDDHLVVLLLKTSLEDVWDVETASDGEEGFGKLLEGKYDFIISDINMPKMDGMAFYEQSIGRFAGLQSRFLFLTGYVSQDVDLFFHKNKLSYMKKPARMDALRKYLEKTV